MKLRHVAALALVVVAAGACKKKAPPTEAPTPTVDADAAARERARADSIAAAETARRERDAARAAEAARARAALTEIVFFDYDSERLSPEAEEKLRAKAEILRANPRIQLRIEAHADERGSTEYNLALGQRRAESVRSFLAGYGIGEDRLATLSYGEERPLEEESSEAAWARNRRAEFVVTAGDLSVGGR